MEFARRLVSDHPLFVAGAGVVGFLFAAERLSSRSTPPNTAAVKSASVRWGKKRHVVEIEVSLSAPLKDSGKWDYFCNVYGSGIPGIAAMFLPLPVGQYFDVELNVADKILIGLGGSVQKSTILEQLEKRLVSADKPVILELLRRSSKSLNDASICAFAVSPKVLYESLRDDAKDTIGSIILPDSSPGVAVSFACRPRERTIFGVLSRFAICPFLSCAVACRTASKTNGCTSVLLKTFPDFPSFGFASASASIASVLPPMPASYLQAFDLGVIQGKLALLVPGTGEYSSTLAEAGTLLGRSVSAADIDVVRGELVKLLTHRSLGQRVAGLFTFVNLMWLAAIFGITISVGPVLWLVTGPLRRLLARLGGKVKAMLIWLLENVITPVATCLHQHGVFEVAVHIAALTLYLQALRMPDGGAGTYIAISGIAAAMGATAYSALVVNPMVAVSKLPIEQRRRIGTILAPLYPAFFCVPAAIQHQSLLLGFASVASILHAFGFGVAAYPFCYCIGWDSEDTMVRTTAACGVGLASFVALRFFQVDTYYVKPFVAPVSVLGGMGHYLGLLICSNEYRWWRGGKGKYVKYNISMLISLLASALCGNMMGMAGLKNTAITFGVLWLIDKTRELREFAGLNLWLFIFGGSIATYYTALWLHANPAFVVSLFTALDSK